MFCCAFLDMPMSVAEKTEFKDLMKHAAREEVISPHLELWLCVRHETLWLGEPE